MMTGTVSGGLQPLLALEILGSSGKSDEVETVIDTGFDAELVLPPAVVAALGLRRTGSYPARLANGTLVSLDYFQAVVIWHGRPRTIEVLAAGSLALLGMGLLRGSRLLVNAAPGGVVTIDELP